MNPWQLAQQLKHELAQIAWPAGSKGLVFGPRSVFVFAGAPSDDLHPPAFPFALITIEGGTPDDDEPSILEQSFSVLTAVEAAGDPIGEFAVIGSSRADMGKSAGAGIGEVAERVRKAAQDLSTFDGASILLSGSGVTAPASLGRGKSLAFDQFEVTATCTSQPTFSAPQELKLVGGTWSWAGSWCPQRFDFVRYHLVFTTGTAVVATPGDATGTVYAGTDLEAWAPPVAGRVYQIFAEYNARGTGPVDSSPAERGSYLLV